MLERITKLVRKYPEYNEVIILPTWGCGGGCCTWSHRNPLLHTRGKNVGQSPSRDAWERREICKYEGRSTITCAGLTKHSKKIQKNSIKIFYRKVKSIFRHIHQVIWGICYNVWPVFLFRDDSRVANITDFSIEVRNSENDAYFSRFLYRVLTFLDSLRILQFFDFFQQFFFEYKYIWRDRNTSFSMMGGRYDRARCSDNFNHKKAIIVQGYRWAPVSDCIPAFTYCCLWLQIW